MRDVDTAQPDEEVNRLRAEVAEWRRRAEVAETVSAERLARAEAAERALEATNATVRRITAGVGEREVSDREVGEEAEPPGDDQTLAPSRTLRARWRRYVESIN